MHIWPGYCHAHKKIKTERIEQLKADHPKAEFIMHPECGCLTSCMKIADKVVSTEGIIKHCAQSDAKEFIVGTEVGILHRLKKENPQKIFFPAAEEAFCEYMKMNTLEKVLWSLEDMKHHITVPEEIAKKGRAAIQRMLDISEKKRMALNAPAD
jgi:quinolinate synthase